MDRQPEQQSPDKSEAFVSLLTGIHRKLFLYILALVGNPAEAEEVLQNVSLVLWRRFDDFRPSEDFFRWACGIARNEVLKYRERTRRGGVYLSPEFWESIASEAVAAVEEADRRREALRVCIEQLRPHHRQLLVQRYLEQISTERLAVTYGKTVEAIRRMLHRIRQALLDCIERRLSLDQSTS